LEYFHLFIRWSVGADHSPALLAVAIVTILELAQPSTSQAETRYTPSLSLSQRYDSNVYYSPAEFIPADKQAWDFVTTLGGNLVVLNKSRLGDTTVSAGVNGSYFTYTPEFSFVSTNVFATSDMSAWTNELLRGLSLKLTDSFLYTPEPPAFLIGGRPEQSDVFGRGIQAYRANTFSNIFSADGDYSFSRSASLRTAYQYSIFRIGQFYTSEFAPQGELALFDTTLHSISTGPAFTLEGGDTTYLRYTYTKADTTSSIPSQGAIQYTAHTIQPEYVTRFLRDWTATVSGGGTLVEQGGNRIFFSGRFSLANDIDRQTRVTFTISRQAAPAYIGAGGAFISNVLQLYVVHRLTRLLHLTVSGNYAQNKSTAIDFKLETLIATARLEYKLTRSTQLSLSQEYSHFSYTGVSPFDRYATTLMLTTLWK